MLVHSTIYRMGDNKGNMQKMVIIGSGSNLNTSIHKIHCKSSINVKFVMSDSRSDHTMFIVYWYKYIDNTKYDKFYRLC